MSKVDIEVTANVDKDGYTSFQLHEFINVFGNYMYMGNKVVIQPLEIIYEGE